MNYPTKVIAIIIAIVLAVQIVFYITIITETSQKEVQQHEEQFKDTLDYLPNVPSSQVVLEYLKSLNVVYPEIVTAQAILETGWFNCQNCSMEKNNIFGFFYNGEYVLFDSWLTGCEYYKRWQDKYYLGQDYYEFLECLYKKHNGDCVRYAEDSTYIEKLRKLEYKLHSLN